MATAAAPDYSVAQNNEYRERYDNFQQTVSHLYDTLKDHVFLNRLVDFLGTEGAGLDVANSNTRREFRQRVQTILNDVQQRDDRFRGTLEDIGSAAERTKIKSANEFDYLFVLDTINDDDISFTRNTPPSTRPTRSHNLPKSYYDVTFRTPRQGNASRLTWSNSPCVAGDQYLSAQVQAEFQQLVEQAAGSGAHVTTKGPAVTIYFRRGGDEELVKVDLSVALKLDYARFPQDLRPPSALTRPVNGDSSTPPFYIISSGHYWKISECSAEKIYIHSLNDREKIAYKALKYLRDDMSITHDLEDPIMGSYALKVSYIKETLRSTNDGNNVAGTSIQNDNEQTNSSSQRDSSNLPLQRLPDPSLPYRLDSSQDDEGDIGPENGTQHDHETEDPDDPSPRKGSSGVRTRISPDSPSPSNSSASSRNGPTDTSQNLPGPSVTSPNSNRRSTWETQSQSYHTINILERVDTAQSQTALTSVFLHGDPIFKESDRSFLEARRIAIHLRGILREYKVHGIFLTLLCCVIFFSSLINAIILACLMPQMDRLLSTKLGETFIRAENVADIVLFVLRPFSWVSLLGCGIGACYIVGFKFTKKSFGLINKHNVIFLMYWRVLIYFVVFFLLNMICVVCFSVWTSCLDNDVDLDAACTSARQTNDNGTWGYYDYVVVFLLMATEIVSGAIPIIMTIHVIVILSISKCSPKKHQYEWIFFDLLCVSACFEQERQ